MDSRRIVFVLDVVLTSTCVSCANWGAITDYDQLYVSRLYEEEWNKYPPSPSDPAATDADTFVRQQICEQITHSGAFTRYGREPFVWGEDFEELLQPVYEHIFDRIYGSPVSESENELSSSSSSQQIDKYTNVYTRDAFFVKSLPENGRKTLPKRWEEYVFVCLLKRDEYSLYDFDNDSGEIDENAITPIFVSKIYNTYIHGDDDDDDDDNDHRFVFMRRNGYDTTMLVEEPGEVYVAPDFNIELHYLEVRRYRRREQQCQNDPVCELNYETVDKIRTFRLCSIVMTAANFKSRIAYPRRVRYEQDFVEKITFQTEAGRERAGRKKYRECTLQCWANMTDDDVKVFHVSRAYKTNEVFVYVKNRDNSKLYLEAWIRKVRLVREREDPTDDSEMGCGRFHHATHQIPTRRINRPRA